MSNENQMQVEEESQNPQIDEDLLSRVLCTYGSETVSKIMQMRVFLSGLRGVGIETAKNLILGGPKEVTLHDNNLVEIKDMGCNFYLKEEDVGTQSRAKASLNQLRELNTYTNVNLYQEELNDLEFLKDYDIVVMTDCYDQNLLSKVNIFCRQNRLRFIYTGNLGLYGFCFTDFGDNHVVYDNDGEEIASYVVVGITQSEQAIVSTDKEKGKPHGFETGDFVTFREIQGMTEVNKKIYKVERKTPYSFALLNTDTRQFHPFTNSGFVEQVKVPQSMKFKNFEESLLNPFLPDKQSFEICDWSKMDNPNYLHIILQGMFKYVENNKGQLPKLHSTDDAQELIKIVEKINNERKQNGQFSVESVDSQIIKNVCMFSRTQISPFVSFWGGIVAQEIIKLTGKYTPLRQWLHYDCFEALPQQENVDRTVLNSRYDDYISLFGRESLNKLQRQKTFLVGAGALGCEYIKMFALMGMGLNDKSQATLNSNGGGIIVTDDDHIEISNLTRQFLFRRENIGTSKSECAAFAGRQMNNQLQIKALKEKVYEGNERIFNDQFWDSVDLVVNAVDNLKARFYVDGRCVWYQKPLFEAGTLGTKSNSQIILPNQSVSYSDYVDQNEEQYHVCTIKNFPYQIEHTIQWARDYFQGVMVEGPSETQKFLNNPNSYITSVKEELKHSSLQLKQRLEIVKQLAQIYQTKDYKCCIQIARQMFEEIFYTQIAKLLFNFPADSLNESGQPYWQGTKRAPNPIKFSTDDDMHIDFIQSVANIYAYIFGLPYCQDRVYIKEMASQVEVSVPNFELSKTQNIENEKEEEKEVDDLISSLMNSYGNTHHQGKQTLSFKIQDFEKDDATNYHVSLVASISNLRARNYRIKEVSTFKVRFIAGKIVPAIAATTAEVVGVVGMEIIKYINNAPFSAFRNSFCNLGVSLFVFSEVEKSIVVKDKEFDPVLCGPTKAIPSNFTKWDKIIVKGPYTVSEFLEYFDKTYQVTVQLIQYGKKSVYNSYNNTAESEQRKNVDLKQLVETLNGESLPPWKNYLELDVCGETKEGVDFVMPPIKYTF